MDRRPQDGAGAGSRLSLRLEFGPHGAIGHGKIRLLELVDETGSIAAAGRAMGMSYRRAWLLIDSLGQAFGRRIVETRIGGTGGGEAVVTAFGRRLVADFRSMETDAARAVDRRLRALADLLAPAPLPGAAVRKRRLSPRPKGPGPAGRTPRS